MAIIIKSTFYITWWSIERILSLRSISTILRSASVPCNSSTRNHAVNTSKSSKISGSRKLSSDQSSDKLFCKGVPVNKRRLDDGYLLSSLYDNTIQSISRSIFYKTCCKIRIWYALNQTWLKVFKSVAFINDYITPLKTFQYFPVYSKIWNVITFRLCRYVSKLPRITTSNEVMMTGKNLSPLIPGILNFCLTSIISSSRFCWLPWYKTVGICQISCRLYIKVTFC